MEIERLVPSAATLGVDPEAASVLILSGSGWRDVAVEMLGEHCAGRRHSGHSWADPRYRAGDTRSMDRRPHAPSAGRQPYRVRAYPRTGRPGEAPLALTGTRSRALALTPPGSACSIHLGTGITEAVPGSVEGLQLVVRDIEAAREVYRSTTAGCTARSGTCHRPSSRRCSTLPVKRRESKVEGLYRTQGASHRRIG